METVVAVLLVVVALLFVGIALDAARHPKGGRHSWWHNPSQRKRGAVPRHNEINDHLARK